MATGLWSEPTAWVGWSVTGGWIIAATILAAIRRGERLWAWCAVAGMAGALALAVDWGVAALVPAALVVMVAVPDGRFRSRAVAASCGAGVVAGIGGSVVVAGATDVRTEVFVAQAVVLGSVGLFSYVARCRRSGAVERARLQWVGWGVVLSASLSTLSWLLHQLLDWPHAVGAVALASTIVIPIAIVASAVERLAVRIDRLLVRTIEAGGLALMVFGVYLVVVLGFGDAGSEAERSVLGRSIVAAIVAVMFYAPVRVRLAEFANRRVYGELSAPDEPIQTFGARMSRAIPLDELLLQLAESLKKSMLLAGAQVWIGAEGTYECAASVPFAEPERITISNDEVEVVARAHVSGNAWVQVWLPKLLDAHPERSLRVSPLAHSGELLGLIVCSRGSDAVPFTDDDDRVLTDLSRQVGLALHNSRLDSALQASLDDLRIANEELRASRARIVATADQARRQIERNLHDGAQQHLVALAVKLGLAKQLLASDPAVVESMLDELRSDAQETLTQLRELAHGIYPPLLIDRGLGEALRAAANRAVLPTQIHATADRFGAEIEAAVYFCCLEAMQNAGKHAGGDACIEITVDRVDGQLVFEVADDGVGFDLDSRAAKGHGFVNMADRLGAIGGRVDVESSPGNGTRVRGRIPIELAEE